MENDTDYERLKREIPEMAKAVELFPPEVRAAAFQVLVDCFFGGSGPTRLDGGSPANTIDDASPPAPARAKVKSPKREAGSRESYAIDRQLNLRGDKSIPSFKDFHRDKAPQSKMEFNAVAVYYLHKIVGLSPVTLNHVFTCYAEVKERPPEHFKQSLIDTKNKQGWVELTKDGNVEIPHRGVVFVEHDLPRTKGTKAEAGE